MRRNAFPGQSVSLFACGSKGFDEPPTPSPSIFDLRGERNHMTSLKSIITVLLLGLGVVAGPAQAFFPMMLAMLPMMVGGQHAMGETHESDGKQGIHESHASQSDGEQETHAPHALAWGKRQASSAKRGMPRAIPSESQQILSAPESASVTSETTK